MKKEREQIKIKKEVLIFLIEEFREIEESDVEESEKYKLHYDKILSSDAEDGGALHEVVIQRLSDEKYFMMDYTDWDIMDDIEDLDEFLEEVFAEEKTILVFT